MHSAYSSPRGSAGLLLGCLFLGLGCERDQATSHPAAREIRIAAAADLRFALDELIAAFVRTYPDIRIKPTYGSSGNFRTQLMTQAPFDVYLSADAGYPQQLADAGTATPDGLFIYAVGRIVVWTKRGAGLNLRERGTEALTDPSVRKVAIANPAHAPYGRAAEAALKRLGVYERVKHRLALADNVAQAAQFVESGAADAGVIALSLAVSPAMRDRGEYWEVPLDAYPRMTQGGIILKWAKDEAAAKRFRDFLLGDRGQAILERYGFSRPSG